MKKTNFLFLILILTPFMVGCGPAFLKKMIKDNPEIVTESIKANPAIYFEALSEAQKTHMMERNKQKRKDSLAAREKEFANPKKPDTPSSRVYFGDKNAPVTIVEYSDFQCGYCAKAAGIIKEVLKMYPKEVRVLYKHKPIFPGSSRASEYYEAVGKQSSEKALKFHDMVFAQKGGIKQGDAFFNKLAKNLKVDMAQLKKDLKKVSQIVKDDSAEATKFGFDGTPGFLVGGISVGGALPVSHFKEIIDRLLADKNGGKKKEADKKEADKKTS